MDDSTTPASAAARPALGPHALSLLCSRLCHDLISPLSAVNHGAELLTELEPGDSEAERARDLVADSAGRAGDRLQLLRLAFAGMAERGGVPAAELARLTGRCLPKHVALDWDPGASTALDDWGGPAIKIAANLVQLAAELVGGRGRVTVAPDAAGAALAVTAEGGHAGLDEARTGALQLALDETALTTETVLAYHTGFLVRAWAMPLSWEAPEAGGAVTLYLRLGPGSG